MDKPVSIAEARERKKRADYAKLVMRCWDDADHADRVAQKETAASVNQKAREKL